MKNTTIFKKQMLLYMGILLISFGFFGAGISVIYTRQFMNEQEQQLILQCERFKESVSSLYFTGVVDMSRMSFELQIMEKYMGASVFFMNDKGQVSLVSQSVNQQWVGQTITDEAVSIVLAGRVATVKGKIGGMFNETVLTVGYPIVVGDKIIGGVFMCKPITVLQEAIKDMRAVVVGCMIPVFIIGAMLIYYSTKRIIMPLRDMNDAAKIIADGNFQNRIQVESGDEVGQLAQSFNYMAESLEKTENSRQKFIANISHDLRSPLTSIQGFISAIADGTIPPERQSHYLNIVLEETARLTKLANDMTDLSKVEAGAISLEVCEFDINDMIRDSLNVFETRLSAKKIRTQAVFAEEITVVLADPNMIQRVIQNLLDNAIKFTPQDGEITVETTVKSQKVFVSVRDNGEGISREEQKKVFERFFKADSSRGLDKGGIGLGLSIVKEFIKAHGEKIEVKSNENVGTEFTFSLKKIETK
ncbi:MAG: HAMP domain-containing sensor histidine kinase [Lachnospiraceae bacterium]|nr:HAMP domain-containing sensor histidine kinase [Lachnospiraceae bacterium]